MKKTFTILITFICCTLINAQSEWAPIGAKWHYTYWQSFTTFQEYVLEVEVVEQVEIQEKTCSVLKGTPNWISWGNSCGGFNLCMYEEGEKVFFYNAVNETFDLLYDFSKEAGESWTIPVCENKLWDFDSIQISVDSVTFIEINGQSIRTQHVQLYADSSVNFIPRIIYEGIGGARDMWFIGVNVHADAGIAELRCYESEETGILNFIDVEACDELTPAEETLSEPYSLQIYPNPASDILTVQISNTINVAAPSFRIVNINGKTMEHINIDAPKNGSSISVKGWPVGIYVLQYMDDGVLLRSKRFVVLK